MISPKYDGAMTQMKSIYLCFHILILSIILSGCAAQEVRIRRHYQLINLAELNIVEGDLKQANRFYRRANKTMPLKAKSLENWLIVCNDIGKYNTAKNVAETMLGIGVPNSFFSQKKFNRFNQSNIWIKADNPDDLTYSESLKKKVDQLYLMDQEFRYDYQGFYDTIRIIDSLLDIEVSNILLNYGSLNSLDIGVRMVNDTTINYGWNPFTILLIHQVKRKPKVYEEILSNLVKSGGISPNEFATQSCNFQGSPIRLNCHQDSQSQFIQVGNKIYTCNESDVQVINEYRYTFFLEPLEDQRKKIFYYYEKNKRFKLKGHFSVLNTQGDKKMTARVESSLVENGFILFRELDPNKSFIKK